MSCIPVIYDLFFFFHSPSTPSSPINHTSSPEKKTRVPRSQHVEAVLQVLRDHWLSPFDLIIAILDDSNPQYSQYRHELYKKENRKLGQIFDHICSNPAGHIKFEESILSRAVDLVCATVSSEIDAVKDKERLPGLSKINPDFILGWNVSSHQETAPVLFQLLVTAAESAAAKEKNKKKSPVAVSNSSLKIRFCYETTPYPRHVTSSLSNWLSNEVIVH